MPDGVNKSIAGDFINAALRNPELQKTILEALFGLLAGLIGRIGKKGPKPDPRTGPPPVVLPDDDPIPPPPPLVVSKKVVTAEIRIQKAQYSRERFPDVYTDDNPFGLVDRDSLRQIERGEANLNWGSKIWVDITARDESGKEFLADAIVAAGLAYRCEHYAKTLSGGLTFIKGGGGEQGHPLDWQQQEEGIVGLGVTAWINSLGFNAQMKVHDEGQVELWGKVGGVETNHLTIKVS